MTKLLADGAWTTVLIVNRNLVVVPLSPWQHKALDRVYCEAQTLVTHAFLIQGTALVSDPHKQKGHAFQMMFALELGRLDSPLWNAIGETPVAFTAYRRFDTNQTWEANTLYVVTESSQRKLADLVFLSNSSTVVALELKCGDDCYVASEFRTYNDRLKPGAQDQACEETPEIKHVFVSCGSVPFLDKPTSKPKKADGTPDNRFTVVDKIRCAGIVNNARELPTYFLLHPKLGSTKLREFADNITRSPSAGAVIHEAADRGVREGSSPRPKAHRTEPMEFVVTDGKEAPEAAPAVWVIQLDADGERRGSAFEVTPAKNHVDGLKKAIKAEWDANKEKKADALAMRIYKQGPDGKWVEETRASGRLSSSTEDFPYGFVLP